MKFEDIFGIAPVVGIAAGLCAHHLFGASFSAAVIIGSSVGLLPHSIMAVLAIVMVVFFGGLNDRPPCECGRCLPNEYSYDEKQTAERNRTRDTSAFREWCYRCPKCQRLWVARDSVFYRVDGNRLVPYRKKTRFGRWGAVIAEPGGIDKA